MVVLLGCAGGASSSFTVALEDVPTGVTHYPEQQLFLVRQDATVLAFSDRTPWVPPSRAEGCVLRWQPEATFVAGDGTEYTGLFKDPCSGAAFTQDGKLLYGPPERGLDSFDVTVEGGQVVVDLSAVREGPPRAMR